MVMTTLYVRQQKRHSLLDSVRDGEGGTIWGNDTETCVISYKKRIASPGSMQDTGCLGLVHWDDPEGWYGDGGRRGIQDAPPRHSLYISLLFSSCSTDFCLK